MENAQNYQQAQDMLAKTLMIAPAYFILGGTSPGQVRYEPRYEKTGFCICENKDADQLRGNREADQRLCFRYIDNTIPLLPKSEIQASSLLLWLYSPVCVGPGRKPRTPVFSQRGSYIRLKLQNK